jgi:hypothetical protein
MKRGAIAVCTLALFLCTIPTLAQKIDDGWQWDQQPGECPQIGCDNFKLLLDATWTIVPMASDQSCAGPADPNDPCQRNDDDHSPPLAFVNFSFDFFGDMWSDFYLNNNGNVSFGVPFCTYTSEPFPINDFPMVAPFWADVDTRPSPENGTGFVWIKHGSGAVGDRWMAATWDHVGYYSMNTDKKNTFQCILSDGNFPVIGVGNNVCFIYCDMQWTTGDASGGVGGFGGTPATVGANYGNGIDYFLIGRFDHEGIDYDGPGGNPDGVSWLDDQNICFNIGEQIINVDPIPVDFPPGDSLCVTVGDTLHLTVGFIGPEAEQTVHTDVDDGGLANLTWISTDGNPSTVEFWFYPDASQVGNHIIHLTATDDGIPPGTTEKDLMFCVETVVPTENKTWGQIKTIYR